MRIIISNDDGIQAPGIRALAKAATAYGEVVVVAPDSQRSASSHGISLHQRMYVSATDMGITGVTGYAVSGTPVDSVKWGVVMCGNPHFDMMLSGINEGPNLATDVVYSGTVSAAVEASMLGLTAIAFSAIGPNYAYDDAAVEAMKIVCWVQKQQLPPASLLNVNFPQLNVATAPWKVTRLGNRSYVNRFNEKIDEEGRTFYHHAGEELAEHGGEETDVMSVRRGNISITPMQYRFTSGPLLDSLKV